MRDSSRLEERRVSFWSKDDLPDFEEVQRHLPVVEQSLIPVARGNHLSSVEIAATDEVALIRSRVNGGAVGVNVLKPECFSLMIPSPEMQGFHINGQAVRSGTILPTGSDHEFYLRGGRRHLVGAAVSRSKFIGTLAALRGVDPEDVALDSEPVVVPPRVHARLFGALIHFILTSMHRSEREFNDQLFSMLMDTYLYAKPHRSPYTRRRSSSDSLIVRRAEECFASAEGKPVSLADLCLAAGVGKSTLYRAFHSLCGEAPLSYFQKRRFAKARSLLLRSAPDRGAVKSVALTVGLTELGRFSTGYRRFFGESPSATLNRSAA